MIVVTVIAVIALAVFMIFLLREVVTEEELTEGHQSLLADVTKQFRAVHESVQRLDNRGHRRRLEALLGELEEFFRDEHLERLRADLAAAGNLRDEARADREHYQRQMEALRAEWQAESRQLRDEVRTDRELHQRQMEALWKRCSGESSTEG